MTKQLHLTLNPAGAAEPAKRTAIIASQVVATCLRAFEAELDDAPVLHAGDLMGYRFTGLEMSADERRQTYRNWVLSKGFHDLARGVRETLEEAALYLDLIGWQPEQTTLGEVEAKIAAARSNAQRLQFPALLGRVNRRLTEPLTFEAEFLSMQRVRNCLEHRSGRVEQRDADPESDALSLTFPRLKTFYMRGDEEIEVAAGEVLDTHAPGVRQPEDGMVAICIKRVSRTRSYRVGDAVVISAADFAEVAMACHFFANDVARKLPLVPQVAPSPP